MAPSEREAFAYHEAGHAVIAWALGCEVRFVAIDANGGKCQCGDPPGGEHERKIMLCFAGPAAQRRHAPSTWRDWHGYGDSMEAVKAAERYSISDERVSALIGETHELVDQHWTRIERFAQALLERGTLQASEIDALRADPREPRA